jgi:hypothetical protein
MSTGTGPAAGPGPGQPLNISSNGGDALIKGIASGRSKHVGTGKYPSNSGKNSAGVASGTPGSNQPENVNGDGGGDGKPAVKARTKRALYGFMSGGPKRAAIPKGNKAPPQKGKPAGVAPAANPDLPTYESLFGKKINRALAHQSIQTVGNLSHARVGQKQKLCTFGSHRRYENYAQGTKAMLIGPFSDHMPIKHRRIEMTNG